MKDKLAFCYYCFLSPLVLSSLLLAASYWVAAQFVDVRMLIEFIDGLAVAFSFSVFVVYCGRFFNSVCHHNPDVYDLLISGIAVSWLIFGIDRGWRMIARVTSSPGMLDTHVIGGLLLGSVFCASLHLLVRGAADRGRMWHGIPPRAWRVIFLAVILGIMIGTAAVTSTWRFYD
jgi:hypothetical protein